MLEMMIAAVFVGFVAVLVLGHIMLFKAAMKPDLGSEQPRRKNTANIDSDLTPPAIRR